MKCGEVIKRLRKIVKDENINEYATELENEVLIRGRRSSIFGEQKYNMFDYLVKSDMTIEKIAKLVLDRAHEGYEILSVDSLSINDHKF